METRGFHHPETRSEVREIYEELGPVAESVIKEAARAMNFDREEFRDRLSESVFETARDALFASLLEVHVGNSEAFDTWRSSHPDLDVHLEGSEHVDGRAWHPVPVRDEVAAVTFQNEPDAAVSTVRRMAFGRFYADLLD
ncbi:MAG: DUF5809 family protein [Halodesulfurarchaeum sp.]